MRLELRAIGRLKAGAERTLLDGYLKRANQAGRPIGLGPVEEREIDPRALKTKADETRALIEGLSSDALIFALDETGKTLSSLEFSQLIATARDNGVRQGALLIGGADGHERALLPKSARMLSFGRMTWPHMLCRVMASEQLYRAISVLAGSPYHREG